MCVVRREAGPRELGGGSRGGHAEAARTAENLPFSVSFARARSNSLPEYSMQLMKVHINTPFELANWEGKVRRENSRAHTREDGNIAREQCDAPVESVRAWKRFGLGLGFVEHLQRKEKHSLLACRHIHQNLCETKLKFFLRCQSHKNMAPAV